jgi:hypothetical protein
MLKEEAGAT